MKTTVFAVLLVTIALNSSSLSAESWSRFRGPNGSGVAATADIPSEWSSEKNLRWRTELPGRGTSSPIVSGDRVFLTCYSGYGLDVKNPGKQENLSRHLLAFDRETGKELWRKTVPATEQELPYQGFMTQHGYASSTPTTDGDHIFVLFGKSGLFCFDLEGNQVWQTSVGTKSDPARWGDGTSPILVDNLVVVNAGILGNKLIAVNKTDGSIAWKIEDEAFTNCWSTPTVVPHSSGDQILFAVPGKIVCVDPASGTKNWEHPSPLGESTGASIVTSEGNAYLMGGRPGQAIAIKCGENEASEIWETSIQSAIDTPVLVNGRLYWQSTGVFVVADAKTGEYVYRERLKLFGKGATFPNVDYSSPVAVGNKIVQFMRNGESFIIEAGPEFKLLQHNPGFDGDDSAFSSTPAIEGDQLFVRSYKYLYAIGK